MFEISETRTQSFDDWAESLWAYATANKKTWPRGIPSAMVLFEGSDRAISIRAAVDDLSKDGSGLMNRRYRHFPCPGVDAPESPNVFAVMDDEGADAVLKDGTCVFDACVEVRALGKRLLAAHH